MEPALLPMPDGGTYRGVGGYVALMERIGDLLELEFHPERLQRLDATTALL